MEAYRLLYLRCVTFFKKFGRKDTLIFNTKNFLR